MAKKITQKQAIEFILSHGWQPCYPVNNVPLPMQFFWDDKDKKVAYTLMAAYKEILKRQ